MKTLLTSIALAFILSFAAEAQQIINLYQRAIPNSKATGIKGTD